MTGIHQKTQELSLKNVTDPAIWKFWEKVDQINHQSTMHALIFATAPFLIILIVLLFVFQILYHLNNFINYYYKLQQIKKTFDYDLENEQLENKVSVYWHRNLNYSQNERFEISHSFENSIVIFQNEKI
jgi:hypothetical protein